MRVNAYDSGQLSSQSESRFSIWKNHAVAYLKESMVPKISLGAFFLGVSVYFVKSTIESFQIDNVVSVEPPISIPLEEEGSGMTVEAFATVAAIFGLISCGSKRSMRQTGLHSARSGLDIPSIPSFPLEEEEPLPDLVNSEAKPTTSKTDFSDYSGITVCRSRQMPFDLPTDKQLVFSSFCTGIAEIENRLPSLSFKEREIIFNKWNQIPLDVRHKITTHPHYLSSKNHSVAPPQLHRNSSKKQLLLLPAPPQNSYPHSSSASQQEVFVPNRSPEEPPCKITNPCRTSDLEEQGLDEALKEFMANSQQEEPQNP